MLYLRIGFQRQLKKRYGFKRLANRHSQYTQIVVGIRVLRLGLQNGPIKVLCILKLARSVGGNATL